jgi:uncharacterized protein YndB with AHSA1/START domain
VWSWRVHSPRPPATRGGANIVSRREFSLDRDVVFQAFADPTRLVRWWGPAGFENVFHTFEFRPGGRWHFRMRAPDGTEYDMHKRFVEVRSAERLVIDHREPPSHRFRLTIAFEDYGGGTRLTWHLAFAVAEEARRVREVVLAANEENFDRLATELAREG